MTDEPLATNVDPSELSWAVRATQRAYDELNQSLARRMELPEADLVALDVLTESGPIGPAELGRRLGMTSASATALADRLERAGHVKRVRHSDDRRRIILEVTDQARTEMWRHIGPISDGLDAIASTMDDEQRAVVLRFLEAVSTELRRHAADQGGSEPR